MLRFLLGGRTQAAQNSIPLSLSAGVGFGKLTREWGGLSEMRRSSRSLRLGVLPVHASFILRRRAGLLCFSFLALGMVSATGSLFFVGSSAADARLASRSPRTDAQSQGLGLLGVSGLGLPNHGFRCWWCTTKVWNSTWSEVYTN